MAVVTVGGPHYVGIGGVGVSYPPSVLTLFYIRADGTRESVALIPGGLTGFEYDPCVNVPEMPLRLRMQDEDDPRTGSRGWYHPHLRTYLDWPDYAAHVFLVAPTDWRASELRVRTEVGTKAPAFTRCRCSRSAPVGAAEVIIGGYGGHYAVLNGTHVLHNANPERVEELRGDAWSSVHWAGPDEASIDGFPVAGPGVVHIVLQSWTTPLWEGSDYRKQVWWVRLYPSVEYPEWWVEEWGPPEWSLQYAGGFLSPLDRDFCEIEGQYDLEFCNPLAYHIWGDDQPCPISSPTCSVRIPEWHSPGP